MSETERKRLSGKVRWYDTVKCFGFIGPDRPEGDKADDVFFHRKELPADSDDILPNTPVTFEIDYDRRNRRCAVNLQFDTTS